MNCSGLRHHLRPRSFDCGQASAHTTDQCTSRTRFGIHSWLAVQHTLCKAPPHWRNELNNADFGQPLCQYTYASRLEPVCMLQSKEKKETFQGSGITMPASTPKSLTAKHTRTVHRSYHLYWTPPWPPGGPPIMPCCGGGLPKPGVCGGGPPTPGCCDCTSGRFLRSCMKWQIGQATSLYLCVARGMRGMKHTVNHGHLVIQCADQLPQL